MHNVQNDGLVHLGRPTPGISKWLSYFFGHLESNYCRSRKLIPSSLDEQDVLAPWIFKMASSILHAAMWGKQDIDSVRAVDLGRVYGVSICAFPQMERLRVVPFPSLMLLLG